jgi:hypothetical protein
MDFSIRTGGRWLAVPIAALLGAVGCQAETPKPVAPRSAVPTLAAPSPQTSPTIQVMTEEDAIQLVLKTSAANGSALFALFPRSVGSQGCQIRGGGPPPGISVPGTCRTEVEASASNYVVRFVEIWDASRFHYATEPGSGELQHTWAFAVSLSGLVVVQADSGNFPPQWVK